MQRENGRNRITVVIPCYKSEKYLQHTVEEILSEAVRNHWDDFRIILVDDCSTDGSSEFCDENGSL